MYVFVSEKEKGWWKGWDHRNSPTTFTQNLGGTISHGDEREERGLGTTVWRSSWLKCEFVREVGKECIMTDEDWEATTQVLGIRFQIVIF